MNLIKEIRSFFKRNSTRGYGLLEYFLAIQRAKIANRLIIKEHRSGKILDIGCGSYPIFLVTTEFVEKFGIDKIEYSKSALTRRFKLLNYDIEKGCKLPFDDDFIDTITMLAICEHLEYTKLLNIISEVYRVLKQGGACIITVPAPWTGWVLNFMSFLRLISSIELAEHKTDLKNSEILAIFKNANFKDINFGYFEFFMNRWFIARK